ncbi:type 3 dihydrofolate reductase [Simiduia sp. 21SJ11W-1]|uniref:type 3 dihydrofolate reductase n=1 Tax=Simiduia sp. 21SJ11W-1 TaxID=2909669 RepID=UPI00209DEC02|nr:type 3 dihydrofolate reductase [Simiduia sp. 21SJ11W-1]UTA48117.1 type 3 dihydrofolate reductase [Simiduia sp. 21SJ11W-1]
MTEIALIVAMAENRTIGRDNQLPWHLPDDLAYFKRVTLGKPIIMGRKTYESIGRPLPGRANLVVTRQPGWAADGVTVCNSLEAAIAQARAQALAAGVDEVMVIGGSEIYAQALPEASRLYLTQVHAQIDGDAHFPPLDAGQWQQVSEDRRASSGSNPHDYSFIVLRRT